MALSVPVVVAQLLLLCAPAASRSDDVWPQPLSSTSGDVVRGLTGDNFSCTVAGSSNDILTAACARYEGYLRSRDFPVHSRTGAAPTAGASPLTTLIISATDTTSEFSLHTNESYTLTVPEAGAAQLHAPHVIGALRGLETFFQVLKPQAPAKFLVSTPLSVDDAPRFAHRGLLLDTGRHFYPVHFIKHIVEGMAMEKLSVLHWHVTEILSFPLVVESVPELADTAAFSPAAQYSHEDVAEIVAHARLHGIRVIPGTMRFQLFRNFLARNAESLLGFPTISRWVQIFCTDYLESHSTMRFQLIM